MEGFGAHSRIHTARLVDIAPDLPIVVEIVDDEAKIQAFLPVVEAMVRRARDLGARERGDLPAPGRRVVSCE
jgi:PII-like signaling protein